MPVSSVLKSLDEERWFEASCGEGSKGVRIYDWQAIGIGFGAEEGWKRYLLVRRSKTDLNELRAYACFAPENVPIEKLIQFPEPVGQSRDALLKANRKSGWINTKCAVTADGTNISHLLVWPLRF